jgi:hypothetical protein
MKAFAQELGIAGFVTFMGRYGRRCVENKLAWHHEVSNLLAANEAFWRGAVISPTERSVEA